MFLHASVLPYLHCPSICPSCYLLHCKSPGGIQPNLLHQVREQHYFSVRPSFRVSVVRHAIASKITGRDLTKLATWLSLIVRMHESKSVSPPVRSSDMLLASLATSVRLWDGALSTAHSSFFILLSSVLFSKDIIYLGDWSWNIFYGHSHPSADSRRAVVCFWRKNVHNTGQPLRGLSLPSKRVIR